MAGKLLARQLKRSLSVADDAALAELLAQLNAGKVPEQVPDGFATQLAKLLGMVDDAYAQFERDLALRSRSLELSSAELNAANEKLREESASQQRVIESLQAAARNLLERAGKALPQAEGQGQDLAAVSQLVTQLIDENQRAEEELRFSEERFNLALTATEDGLWDWNPQTNVAFFSARWKTMLGYEEDELANEFDTFARLVHPDDLKALLPDLQVHLAGLESSYRVEFRMRRKDQSWCWVRSTGKVVRRNAAGEATRMIGTHHDITADKAAELELLRAKQAAEAASRAKSDFMANVSHELRTPMNGIIGMTDLALATPLTPDQHEYLSMVKVSADSLLTVINDILDFSRLEAGQVGVEVSEFSVGELVANVIQSVKDGATSKGLGLCEDIRLPAANRYQGDWGRIRQVLFNLLSNAVKFTVQGTVTLKVEAVSEGLSFVVSDTGIGISSEQLGQIFEAFSQGDGSRSREYGGTGLGLTICRSLVDLMGGHLSVSSEPGQGSNFSVVLPLTCSSSHDKLGQTESAGAALLQLYDLSMVMGGIGNDEGELHKLVEVLLQDLRPMVQKLGMIKGEADWAHADLLIQGIVGAVSVFGASPLLAAAEALRIALQAGEGGAVEVALKGVVQEAERLIEALSTRVGIA